MWYYNYKNINNRKTSKNYCIESLSVNIFITLLVMEYATIQ